MFPVCFSWGEPIHDVPLISRRRCNLLFSPTPLPTLFLLASIHFQICSLSLNPLLHHLALYVSYVRVRVCVLVGEEQIFQAVALVLALTASANPLVHVHALASLAFFCPACYCFPIIACTNYSSI
jgi:hypothetical protein